MLFATFFFKKTTKTQQPALKNQPTRALLPPPERSQVGANVVDVRVQDEESVPAHVVVHHRVVQGRVQDVLVAHLQRAHARPHVVLARGVRLYLVRDGPVRLYSNVW